MPPASHKTALFRNRYNVIHQRLLRNEAFQSSAVASTKGPPALMRSSSSGLTSQHTHKITPIANLLGRHGSHHMLLGLLSILPTGNLAISDLTGTISLDLRQAVAMPEDSAWFTPGMIVLVDGVYEEEEESAGKTLGGGSGVGGIVGGRFQGFFVGQPPCEKRGATLGISGPDGGPDHTIGGGFGWIDFLGVGSERASGARMRKLEQRILHSQRQLQSQPQSINAGAVAAAANPPSRGRIVIVGELNLDEPRALAALRRILTEYDTEPEGRSPMAFVLAGSFARRAVMAGGEGGGSVEYKEHFDALASVLSDFPALLRSAAFVFVPSDNDGWASAFGAGAAVPLPRRPVPDLFTSRVRRAFANANAEVPKAGEEGGGASGGGAGGEAIWTSNPARVSVFGPAHEIVLFRDDMAARMRRHSVRLKGSSASAGDEEDAAAEGEEQPPAATAEDAMDVDHHESREDGGSSNTAKPANGTATATPLLPHDVRTARRLVKTVLDQGYLAPFRDAVRPVLWDRGSAMHLYPLPTAAALIDATAPPFCLTYEGCHVMNPGAVLVAGAAGGRGGGVGRWVEYELGKGGRVRECVF